MSPTESVFVCLFLLQGQRYSSECGVRPYQRRREKNKMCMILYNIMHDVRQVATWFEWLGGKLESDGKVSSAIRKSRVKLDRIKL
jgi:hypothetical protein